MARLDRLTDLLAGGSERRLRIALARVESAFDESPLTGGALDRAADAYLCALRLTLHLKPSQALPLLRSYDRHIPGDRYTSAFRPVDRKRLVDLASHADPAVVTVVFELAERLRLDALMRETADRLAVRLGHDGDTDELVAHLVRCQRAHLLDREVLTRWLRGYLVHSSLERDAQLWKSFFVSLPKALVPPLCEVYCVLGRCAEALALAETPALEQKVLECCHESSRLSDVQAGLQLARREHPTRVRGLEERAGELLFDCGEYTEALEHYRKAGRPDRASECYERLGQLFEALATCPAEQPERLAALAERCRPVIDVLVGRCEFIEAARGSGELIHHLTRAEATEAVIAGRDEATSLRAVVLVAGRQHFRGQEKQAAPANRTAVSDQWSRFEEEAGELAAAAQRAEESGDCYRAYRLYRQAGRYGDAVRVLQDDATPEGLARQAEAREEAGDVAGAGRDYERAGQLDKAVELFARAGEFADAARCLVRQLHQDAVEDPRLADWLRRARRHDELARLCRGAIERKGRRTMAVGELRRLLTEGVLQPAEARAGHAVLDGLFAQARRAFETRAHVWVAQARDEIDQRYAGIWGLDLGTTNSSVAIYDVETHQPVLCSWKGRVQFASTLTVDARGNELVGLEGEQTLQGLVGHISASKRDMGTRRRYRIRDRSYRPQEVAARLIRQGRAIVEGFLVARVRERVGELARAELGDELTDDWDGWLDWVERHHDLRLDRPRVVLTIPAYFRNNQKRATRDAGDIAGVQVARLLHEPTAACLTAGWERQVKGRVAVVDLGAGTLDLSLVDVADDLYEVVQVAGNNDFGGRELDVYVARALAARLGQRGITVPETGPTRRRLMFAAEQLKMALSSREHAEWTLVAFAGHEDVLLELRRAELSEILEQPLRTLRETCAELKASLKDPPQHLVLVGGQVLSPLVCDLVEDIFGKSRTALQDPRTAVASGAALQAAALDGKIPAVVVDVTPFDLGVQVVDDQGRKDFSILIERNTRIPVERRKTYTTNADGQTEVVFDIYHGQLDPQSIIGHGRLSGIPPVPKGQPQIEVTFAIDANCVLHATARETRLGIEISFEISDPTLLAPAERDAIARRLEQRQLCERLRARVAEADGSDSQALLREWRSRRDSYRPAASLDATTQQTLSEMFADGDQRAQELLLAEDLLRDLVSNAAGCLRRFEAEAEIADLTEGEHLSAALGEQLERRRPLRAHFAAWNAMLVALSETETPQRRFRTCHAAGDYAGALEAYAEWPAGPHDPRDVHRLLDCVAQIGERDHYRHVLAAESERLGIVLLDPSRPEIFLAWARPALTQVRVALANGTYALSTGVLIRQDLVVTNQRWLVDGTRARVDAARVEVCLQAETKAVERILLPDSSRRDIALLRLAEPIAASPLRLGYPKLLQVGDRVWVAVPGAAPSQPDDLLPGLVDGFESFPEQNLDLIKVGRGAPPECSGGPLLNDDGEVIGILAIKGNRSTAEETCFAPRIDALDPLLAQAGFRRW
ncbi:MAG: Hsp70 family protein [Egibacteraceae bacterium]